LFTIYISGELRNYLYELRAISVKKQTRFVIRIAPLFLRLRIAGYPIAGRRFDRTGSCNPAYTLFLVFDLAAAMMICSILKSQTDKRS